ncbi:MAG: T9SS type A sorting domain-containing protein [Vicingaceae bacterium]
MDEQQKSKANFTFYPNPVKQKLNLDANVPLESVVIYSLKGCKLRELNPQEKSWCLPEEKGVYMIRMRTGEGKIISKKVVKR